MGEVARIIGAVQGSKVKEFGSLPDVSVYSGYIVKVSGALYFSDGMTWTNISQGEMYKEGPLLPNSFTPPSPYVSGYIFKLTTTGEYFICDGTQWIKISDTVVWKEMPNSVYGINPSLSQVQTWVDVNLTADEKRHSKVYLLESALTSDGYGISNTFTLSSLNVGSSNAYLSAINIDGTEYPINQNIEAIENITPSIGTIILDYAGCEAAKTAIVNALSGLGISAVVEIYSTASTSAIISLTTKSSSSHTVYFRYTKDGGSTYLSTSSVTSASGIPLSIGSDISNPDKVWEVIDGVASIVFSRKNDGSVYYIKKGLTPSEYKYAQVGNPNRPFRSTTHAMLYLGISSLPASSTVFCIESVSSPGSSDYLNIIEGNNIKVQCNNVNNLFLVRYALSNRTIVINDPGYGTFVVFKCPNSVSFNELSVKGGSKGSSSSLSFYDTFNENGVGTKVEIFTAAVNVAIHAYSDIKYNINVGKYSDGGIYLNDTSKFSLSCDSDEVAPRVTLNDSSSANFYISVLIASSIIVANESSNLKLFSKVISGAIYLNTNSDVFIDSNAIYNEIIITKTSTTPDKPIYNIRADYVDLSGTVNKLMLGLTTPNIRDFIVNYRFNNAYEVNMFKAVSFTTGITGIEVYYDFTKIILATSSILSWEGGLSGSIISYKGKIEYTSSSDVNLIYYSPLMSLSPNKFIFDCEIYAPNVGVNSRIRLINLGDSFKFSGKIWAPNAERLFHVTSNVGYPNLEISGIFKCNTIFIQEDSETYYPKVFLKDVLYILGTPVAGNEIDYIGSLGFDVLVQNVATNSLTPSTTANFVGSAITRNSNFANIIHI